MNDQPEKTFIIANKDPSVYLYAIILELQEKTTFKIMASTRNLPKAESIVNLLSRFHVTMMDSIKKEVIIDRRDSRGAVVGKEPITVTEMSLKLEVKNGTSRNR